MKTQIVILITNSNLNYYLLSFEIWVILLPCLSSDEKKENIQNIYIHLFILV